MMFQQTYTTTIIIPPPYRFQNIIPYNKIRCSPHTPVIRLAHTRAHKHIFQMRCAAYTCTYFAALRHEISLVIRAKINLAYILIELYVVYYSHHTPAMHTHNSNMYICFFFSFRLCRRDARKVFPDIR